MFTLSRLAWAFLEPANALVLLASAAVVLLLWGRFQAAWRIGAAAALLQILLLNLPLANLVLGVLEHRFPAPALPLEVAGVVVLGGAVDVDLPRDSVRTDAERLVAMAELSRRYPDVPVVFAGGNGRLGDQQSESRVVKPLMAQLGMDPSRVVFETRSRNTLENALFTRQLLKPSKQDRWILVTSALHMARAAGVFRRHGWNVVPYPVGYVTDTTSAPDAPWFTPGATLLWSIAARECVGLVFYRLAGHTAALFPAP